MSITLEKIDDVVKRTGVTYKVAKEVLEECDGDVLEAIIKIESAQEEFYSEEGKIDKGNEIIEKLKEIVKKGNVTKIVLEKDNNTVLDIPVNAGIVGTMFFSPAVLVGILAALASGCELKIIKEDGEVIDIKDITEETVTNVKDKVENIKDKFSKEEKKSEAVKVDIEAEEEEEEDIIVDMRKVSEDEVETEDEDK
jgi:hypothetical protein